TATGLQRCRRPLVTHGLLPWRSERRRTRFARQAGRAALLLHGLGIRIALGLGRLGLIDACGLGIALLRIALFPGHVIGRIDLGLRDLAHVALARLLHLVELGLGYLFLALGFLDADILGVVAHCVAGGAVRLVVRPDPIERGIALRYRRID